MDANITILLEIKKTNLGYSSFLFNDRILDGLVTKIVKKDLRVKVIFGHYKVLLIGQIKNKSK